MPLLLQHDDDDRQSRDAQKELGTVLDFSKEMVQWQAIETPVKDPQATVAESHHMRNDQSDPDCEHAQKRI